MFHPIIILAILEKITQNDELRNNLDADLLTSCLVTDHGLPRLQQELESACHIELIDLRNLTKLTPRILLNQKASLYSPTN